MSLPDSVLHRVGRLVFALGLLALAGLSAAATDDAGTTLTRAQRQIDDGPWREVALPDWPLDPPPAAAPSTVTYRLALPASSARQPGLLMQGLLANAAIRFNGHLLRGPASARSQMLPRGLDRLVVLSLPATLWRAQDNVIEIAARAQTRMSVSRLELGELDTLVVRHRQLVLAHVTGPLLAGGVVGTLGLGMLALWVRLREASFALFAVGSLAWWLVNWMPLFPLPDVGGVAYAIAWISLFGVVVAAFAAFCLRLAGWHSPRIERTLLALALAGPPLLGGASAIGQLDLASAAWRLLLLLGVLVALAAVCRAWWQTRSQASLAMVVCGGIAALLGAHDWWQDLDDSLNNPLLLTTYSGLVFAATATALLVHRYVKAARTSSALNRELEQRVLAQGAQLRQALGDMQAARDEARAADRAKSSFLAVASHDLRQPAHAIGLYLEVLPAGNMDAEQREVLARLRESHGALERMFDALLDISQIDAGTLSPNRQWLSPWELLQRLADESAPAAEAKGLRLALRAGAGAAAVRVHTDGLLLERMLRNLIVNAVKYTRSGGVLLACRLRGRGQRQQLRLEVWDSGSGIAESDQARVFEEFFRVERGRSARGSVDGLGLGLPIVKRLAALLGLQVELRSRPGHGSRFSLTLPLETAAQPQPATAGQAAPATLSGLRLGVMEDDPQVRDAMVRVLRRWGCSVHAAESASELLRTAGSESQSLDLLVVDYTLAGGATGPTEAQAFQAATGTSPKVLVVTGEQSPERLRELAARNLQWLAKPVSPEALRLALAGLLAAR